MAREAAGAGGGDPAARRSRPPRSAQAQQEEQRLEQEDRCLERGQVRLRGHRIGFRRLRLEKSRKSSRQPRFSEANQAKRKS
jgi:hypothetical protein